jgi:hypothetical protein
VQEERLRALRAALGERPFAVAWNAGLALSWEAAAAAFLGE